MKSIHKILLFSALAFNCSGSKEYQMKENPNQNRLQHSSSPYLLQHADNPVDWYPWGKEALEKAKKEDKPILISIGYSSCHWCHVMAHESFEDSGVAAVMNKHFVNIKVDREERPDVDQIYMDAVQAMGINGGWPLNVFLTPEQKPFYGGTYFPKENWLRLLESIDNAFSNERAKLNESADQFANALNRKFSEMYDLDSTTSVTLEDMEWSYDNFSKKFDTVWGGIKKAPKFPMPSIWMYLNQLYTITGNEDILQHFEFTLDKISNGGIYDHIGGGFARYSVDGEWHVPHFEKMLYDNGQLIQLYAQAYKRNKKQRYREVIVETIDWLKREMLDSTNGFYAALDADSEGVEGKFYVWSANEIKSVAKEDFEIISDYYDVREEGNWDETNVLRVLNSDEVIKNKYKLGENELRTKIDKFKKQALQERSKRIRPGLDNKIISGWNALTLTGLLDAFQALGDSSILELAQNNYKFLTESMLVDGKLMHVHGLPTQGFADDYAAMIQAMIKYYETVFDENALKIARDLIDQMIEEFFDENEYLFYYTSDQSEKLIARKSELFDNVIPSSNSIMAEDLYKLGIHLDIEKYKTMSRNMVSRVSSLINSEPEYMPQWAMVSGLMVKPLPEIAIIGKDAFTYANELNGMSIPAKVIMASLEENNLPLLEYKTAINGETTIYVCFNKTCKLPVTTIQEALQQIPTERL